MEGQQGDYTQDAGRRQGETRRKWVYPNVLPYMYFTGRKDLAPQSDNGKKSCYNTTKDVGRLPAAGPAEFQKQKERMFRRPAGPTDRVKTMEWQQTKERTDRIRDNVEKVIVGKTAVIEQILAALLAQGHVLLEDVPGTGKTMLAKALAASLGTDFKRIQFTPDLLPSDLIGINYYNQKEGDFVFRPGALFTHILLADEINRATPRTQSSLLESMEERQITVDGQTYPLERPFFVIATQNPVETQGTFPLPEAQLDRFVMQLSMGYTDREDTLRILDRFINDRPMEHIGAVCTQEELVAMQDSIRTVYIHPDVMAYSAAIVEETRRHEAVSLGVSPRGNLALLRCAQALAVVRGRGYVTPEDIRELAQPVLGHRLMLRGSLRSRSAQIPAILEDILKRVAVPTEDWEKGEKQ